MKKRSRMGGRKSRRLFTSTASLTHALNVHRHPFRGSFRL